MLQETNLKSTKKRKVTYAARKGRALGPLSAPRADLGQELTTAPHAKAERFLGLQ